MHFSLRKPLTLSEAVAVQRETRGSYLAGGTVLLVNNHQGKPIADTLISLEEISALRGIRAEGDCLIIGALTSFDEIERSELVKQYAYALWQAACEVGGPQIRHRATLGGNLVCASPASDGVTPLMALGARVAVFGENGEREIPLDCFYCGKFSTVLRADEIVTSVKIPMQPASVSRFVKVGKRNALSVSCLNLCVALSGSEYRVAVGAVAPEVRLCRKTSDALTENGGDPEAACEIILSEISPIDDRWATASYRRTVCKNLLRALAHEVKEAAQ